MIIIILKIILFVLANLKLNFQAIFFLNFALEQRIFWNNLKHFFHLKKKKFHTLIVTIMLNQSNLSKFHFIYCYCYFNFLLIFFFNLNFNKTKNMLSNKSIICFVIIKPFKSIGGLLLTFYKYCQISKFSYVLLLLLKSIFFN